MKIPINTNIHNISYYYFGNSTVTLRHLPHYFSFVTLSAHKMNSKKALVPFIYFFTLSLGIIVISSYWLVTGKGQIKSSKAQTLDSETNIYLTSEGTQVELFDDSDLCTNSTAQKIDMYFAKNKAPLEGYGCVMTKEAEKFNIDALLIASIAWCESNGGKVTPQYGGIESYNAWGWAVYDNNNVTRYMGSYGCLSWEDCIARVTKGIAKKAQRGLEPRDIVLWYTPASVIKGGGDPDQAPWTLCVNKTIEKILAQEI